MIAALLGLFLIGQANAQPAPSDMPGCVYKSAQITLSNLQTSTVACDINGRIVVH